MNTNSERNKLPNDCSELTGLATADGKTKAWGRAFQDLSKKFSDHPPHPKTTNTRPAMNWVACLSSMKSEKEFRDEYFTAF